MKQRQIFYPNSVENPREKIYKVISSFPNYEIEHDEVKGRDKFNPKSLFTIKPTLFTISGYVTYKQEENGLLAKFHVKDKFIRILRWVLFFLAIIAIITNGVFYYLFDDPFFILYTIVPITFLLWSGFLIHLLYRRVSNKFFDTLDPEVLELQFSVNWYSVKLLVVFIILLYAGGILAMIGFSSIAVTFL